MRVLVTIMILALLALLWASIAIFQHVRRARRRRRRFLESASGILNPVAPDHIVIAMPAAPACVPLEIQPPAPAVKPLNRSTRPPEPEVALLPRPMPLRAGQLPPRRVDFSHYNKDMGDLSDPSPANSRPKIRSTNSD